MRQTVAVQCTGQFNCCVYGESTAAALTRYTQLARSCSGTFGELSTLCIIISWLCPYWMDHAV